MDVKSKEYRGNFTWGRFSKMIKRNEVGRGEKGIKNILTTLK
jgi:hypothetical protein